MSNSEGASRPDGVDRRTLLRYAAVAAGSVAGASVLAACGSEGDGGGGGSSTSAVAPTVKPQPDGDLSWLTWEQYVPESIVRSFEKEYGVKVKQSFMASNQESVRKVAAGVPYDLITTNSGFMEQFVAGGLVQSFDPADMRGWGELATYFQSPWWDGDRFRYSVPYGYGPTGIMYRADKVEGITGNWEDMWSHPEAKGHIYLLSAMGDTLGMALVRNGFDCNSENPEEVAKAADDLIDLKPMVASLTTDIGPPVQRGDAWLMEGWATPIYLGMQESKNPENIRFVTPEVGPLLACDTLSIGKNAKAPGTALLFMDWILKAENNAALGEFTLLKTGAKGGNESFATAVKDYPFFDFSDDLLTPPENWKRNPTGARGQVWNQQWARVNA